MRLPAFLLKYAFSIRDSQFDFAHRKRDDNFPGVRYNYKAAGVLEYMGQAGKTLFIFSKYRANNRLRQIPARQTEVAGDRYKIYYRKYLDLKYLDYRIFSASTSAE